jgi:hypothetical protein
MYPEELEEHEGLKIWTWTLALGCHTINNTTWTAVQNLLTVPECEFISHCSQTRSYTCEGYQAFWPPSALRMAFVKAVVGAVVHHRRRPLDGIMRRLWLGEEYGGGCGKIETLALKCHRPPLFIWCGSIWDRDGSSGSDFSLPASFKSDGCGFGFIF